MYAADALWALGNRRAMRDRWRGPLPARRKGRPAGVEEVKARLAEGGLRFA